MTRALCWITTIAAYASIVAWCGFDMRWWVPVDNLNDARMFALFVWHIASLMVAPLYETTRKLM